MTYSDINTLESPLFNSSLNKPIISYSTYIKNKHKDMKHKNYINQKENFIC